MFLQAGGNEMRRWFAFTAVVFALLFMQVSLSGIAEAARVAVAPIQFNESRVERVSDFSSYYWDIMIERFRYPDYELLDDEKVETVIPEEGLESFDQKTLAAICEKTDAEIIVAMCLDDVHAKVGRARHDPRTKCYMKGEFAGYNRLTGKYYYKKINYNGEIETVLTLRNDWQRDAFASTLKRCLNRMLEGKGKKD